MKLHCILRSSGQSLTTVYATPFGPGADAMLQYHMDFWISPGLGVEFHGWLGLVRFVTWWSEGLCSLIVPQLVLELLFQLLLQKAVMILEGVSKKHVFLPFLYNLLRSWFFQLSTGKQAFLWYFYKGPSSPPFPQPQLLSMVSSGGIALYSLKISLLRLVLWDLSISWACLQIGFSLPHWWDG